MSGRKYTIEDWRAVREALRAGSTIEAASATELCQDFGHSSAVVNARVGGMLDIDVALVGGLQIKELLMKQDALKASANANSEDDFAIAYFDAGEDVLYDGLQQNNAFFGEVLKDDDSSGRFTVPDDFSDGKVSVLKQRR
ncbi:MAG: hypothetical protein IJI68_13805 [Eggerthellaceae bacterium]|nr:hypothetical protein [Eggerthellaceae bacterium]